MAINILIPFFLFNSILLSGQTKILDIAKSPYSQDTSPYYRNMNELIRNYKLEDLKKSPYSFYLRIRTEEQIIELYSSDTLHRNGYVTHYTVSQPLNNRRPKIYSEKIKLTDLQVKRLYQLVDSFNIVKMPSDEKIDCWFAVGEYNFASCKDGPTYYIECSDLNHYSFKNYTCPDTKGCELERQFSYFISFIKEYTGTESMHVKFLNKLPKGHYYNGGYSYYCNIKGHRHD